MKGLPGNEGTARQHLLHLPSPQRPFGLRNHAGMHISKHLCIMSRSAGRHPAIVHRTQRTHVAGHTVRLQRTRLLLHQPLLIGFQPFGTEDFIHRQRHSPATGKVLKRMQCTQITMCRRILLFMFQLFNHCKHVGRQLHPSHINFHIGSCIGSHVRFHIFCFHTSILFSYTQHRA